MIFLGSKQRHGCFWITVTAVYLLTDFSLFSDMRISLDCIFSGLLALTGFVFTARTFITFKLNEVIYSNEKYQIYVEKLKKEDARRAELYSPLRYIDASLGTATYMCIWATAMFLVVAICPKTGEIKLGPSYTLTNVYGLLFDPALWPLAKHNSTVLSSFIRKAVVDLSMTYFVFCIYQMVSTTRAIHENIQDIVRQWEADYREIAKQRAENTTKHVP